MSAGEWLMLAVCGASVLAGAAIYWRNRSACGE
jgi:hypothetical protein